MDLPFLADFAASYVSQLQEQLVALLGLFVELRRLVEELFVKCVNCKSFTGFSTRHGLEQVFCFFSYLSFSTLSLYLSFFLSFFLAFFLSLSLSPFLEISTCNYESYIVVYVAWLSSPIDLHQNTVTLWHLISALVVSWD